jgi:hypothetical protein
LYPLWCTKTLNRSLAISRLARSFPHSVQRTNMAFDSLMNRGAMIAVKDETGGRGFRFVKK